MSSSRCKVCLRGEVIRLAGFGPQPIGHHFLEHRDDVSGTHPIVLGQCTSCGLAQLIDPIPPRALVPCVDWIRYNEPEAHLDALVDTLTRLPGIHAGSRITGISYKEDSTLRRFRDRGFSNTTRLDWATDLGLVDPRAGVESLQDRLVPDRVPDLRRGHATPDLILVRHVIEHTHDTRAFLETFHRWVAPGGHVVFELPDCARGMDFLDYSTFWEDHTLYFVEETFRSALEDNQLEVTRLLRYPGPYEQCLVAVTRPTTSRLVPSRDHVPQERARVDRFAAAFPERRDRIRRQLAEWKRAGPVALFGAGHQASTFLSLVGVADLIDFVIDDHPRKTGRFMPGCALSIVSAETALRSNARVWLSTVGAESERRVLEKNADFVRRGGVFASIYATRADEPFTLIA